MRNENHRKDIYITDFCEAINRWKKGGENDAEKPAVNHVIFICIKRINQICENYDLDLESLF